MFLEAISVNFIPNLFYRLFEIFVENGFSIVAHRIQRSFVYNICQIGTDEARGPSGYPFEINARVKLDSI